MSFASVIFLRSFVTGFVHSYMVENAQIQLIFLLLIKLVILGFSISLKNESVNKISFIFDLGFYLSGLFLDCLIFICNIKSEKINLFAFN